MIKKFSKVFCDFNDKTFNKRLSIDKDLYFSIEEFESFSILFAVPKKLGINFFIIKINFELINPLFID